MSLEFVAMKPEDLWRAAVELYELLRNKENMEIEYQKLFERNPIIFKVLGYRAAASFEKSSGNTLPFCKEIGIRPEPDFLCSGPDDYELTVLDLKTPFSKDLITSRSDGARVKFRSHLQSYISQVQEYISSIKGNSEARRISKKALNMKKISSYSALIIIGMENEESKFYEETILSQYSNRIRIISSRLSP